MGDKRPKLGDHENVVATTASEPDEGRIEEGGYSYKFVVGTKPNNDPEKQFGIRIVFAVRGEGLAEQVWGKLKRSSKRKWFWIVQSQTVSKETLDKLPTSLIGHRIDSFPTSLITNEANKKLTEKYVMLHLIHGGEPPFQKKHVIVESKSTRAGEYYVTLVSIEINTPDLMVVHDLLLELKPYCNIHTEDCDYMDGDGIVIQDYDPDFAKGHREGGTNKIVADDMFVTHLRQTLQQFKDDGDGVISGEVSDEFARFLAG